MNAIKETWQQLVRRRLWPVALLLLAALVAVPMVLAKTPAPPAPAPAAKADDDDVRATYVALSEPGDPTTRRRVLGAMKDPFEPKALPKKKKEGEGQGDRRRRRRRARPRTRPPRPAGLRTRPRRRSPPVAPAPTATPAPDIPAYSIKVRFGTTDGELGTGIFERMSVLPDDEAPVLVYRGVEDGGKVAIFELTGAVVADGDGTCAPTPEDCQYLKLHAGETEFITVTETGDVTDAQYQLDLVKIYKKKTTAKSEALTKASSSKLKSVKRVKLRKRNRYVFDETTGTLHRAHGKTPRGSL